MQRCAKQSAAMVLGVAIKAVSSTRAGRARAVCAGRPRTAMATQGARGSRLRLRCSDCVRGTRDQLLRRATTPRLLKAPRVGHRLDADVSAAILGYSNRGERTPPCQTSRSLRQRAHRRRRYVAMPPGVRHHPSD